MAEELHLSGEKCLRCGAELVTAGVQEFRTGGTSGAWTAMFDIAHWGEDMLGLELLACPECRHAEFRVPLE
jgi:hypothetical protein